MNSDLITLKGGLIVSGEAIELALDFERRGIVLRDDKGTLKVAGPGGTKPTLTAEEPAQIRRLKAHLLAIVAYDADSATEPQQAQQQSVSS